MQLEQQNNSFELLIEGVIKDSIAQKVGIEKGDKLLSINGEVPRDYIDYKFMVTDIELELQVKKPDGQAWIFEIEKDYDEALGIEFSQIIFDELKQCHNKCIFCFVDQAPANCRDTLNLKDDDYRFSFLEGSYITLTNLSKEEMSRIKSLHLSPLNISVHTTDEKLRQQMLKNKNADKILDQIAELAEAGIELNTQIVLCPGINDGEQLEKTIKDLAKFIPAIKSLAVVPVGLTKHRSDDDKLRSFTSSEASEVIATANKWQQKFRDEADTGFIYLADEFYLLAGNEVPNEDYYDSFSQLENGVGMVRLFWNQFFTIENNLPNKLEVKREVTIITSVLGAKALKPIIKILNRIENLSLEIVEIKNHFFGEEVTVTGLLTAGDIIEQLQQKEVAELIIIPEVILNDDNLFLDDISWQEFKSSLSNNKVIRVKNDAVDLVEKILNVNLGGDNNE